MSKTYIITGANGFLGNNIIRELQKTDNEIKALILPQTSTLPLQNQQCKIFYGDILNKDSLTPLFKNSQDITVIHCAAMVYIKSKANDLVRQINVIGTKNIALKALEYNAKLIYINSVHAIPETSGIITEVNNYSPDKVRGIYAKTKAEAAEYITKLKNKLNSIIIQPSGIIGPFDFGNTHMTRLIEQLVQNKLPVIINGGYDFVDVRDVSKGVILADEKGISGESYILSNRFVSIKEIAETITTFLEREKTPIELPSQLIKPFVPLCELYYNIKKETPLFTKYSLETTSSNIRFSHEKATNFLGYQPRDIKETIIDTVKWLNKKSS